MLNRNCTLESSAFNDCKSRVKFLESALAGCRLIASPIPDMVAVGEQSVCLASSRKDWYDFLSSPMAEIERCEMAERNMDFIRIKSNVDELVRLGEML